MQQQHHEDSSIGYIKMAVQIKSLYSFLSLMLNRQCIGMTIFIKPSCHAPKEGQGCGLEEEYVTNKVGIVETRDHLFVKMINVR